MTGHVEEIIPESINSEYGPNGFRFTVYYTNGSSSMYETEGGNLELVAVDCPGTLNFVREEQAGPKYRYYVYTYTESGVTVDVTFFP